MRIHDLLPDDDDAGLYARVDDESFARLALDSARVAVVFPYGGLVWGKVLEFNLVRKTVILQGVPCEWHVAVGEWYVHIDDRPKSREVVFHERIHEVIEDQGLTNHEKAVEIGKLLLAESEGREL